MSTGSNSTSNDRKQLARERNIATTKVVRESSGNREADGGGSTLARGDPEVDVLSSDLF